MIVQCPKCKVRLKIADERVKPEGTRIKCPKCTTTLLVRRPAAKPAKPAEPPKPPKPAEPAEPSPPSVPPETRGPVPAVEPGTRVLVTHGDPQVMGNAVRFLMSAGCVVSTAADGVEAMVKAQKESPDVAVIDVALPKIYGFEVARRLKDRDDTADIKILLVTSIHKDDRYRREPQSLHGGDGYVEEPVREDALIRAVAKALAERGMEKQAPAGTPPPPETGAGAEAGAVSPEDRQRAERLTRTIMSDIALYNPARVEETIRDGTFLTTFGDELREGRKLYETRIGPEVRAERDYFQEAVENFLNKKRQDYGIQ